MNKRNLIVLGIVLIFLGLVVGGLLGDLLIIGGIGIAIVGAVKK